MLHCKLYYIDQPGTCLTSAPYMFSLEITSTTGVILGKFWYQGSQFFKIVQSPLFHHLYFFSAVIGITTTPSGLIYAAFDIPQITHNTDGTFPPSLLILSRILIRDVQLMGKLFYFLPIIVALWVNIMFFYTCFFVNNSNKGLLIKKWLVPIFSFCRKPPTDNSSKYLAAVLRVTPKSRWINSIFV